MYSIQEKIHIYSYIGAMLCDDDAKSLSEQHKCSLGSRPTKVTSSQIINHTNVEIKYIKKEKYQVCNNMRMRMKRKEKLQMSPQKNIRQISKDKSTDFNNMLEDKLFQTKQQIGYKDMHKNTHRRHLDEISANIINICSISCDKRIVTVIIMF